MSPLGYQVIEEHGRIDVVVNCAGSAILSSIADTVIQARSPFPLLHGAAYIHDMAGR